MSDGLNDTIIAICAFAVSALLIANIFIVTETTPLDLLRWIFRKGR